MSGFAFGQIKANQTKKDLQIQVLDKPVTYKHRSGIVPIITGEFIPGDFSRVFPQISPWIMDIMDTYLDPQVAGSINLGFSIICGLRTKHATLFQPLEKDIVSTYWRNSWEVDELKSHMYDECPFVFAAGRGLYSITLSDDLQTRYFYDTTFNKSYFYSPDLHKFVFPIDHLSSLLRKITINFNAKGKHDAELISKVVVGSDPKTRVAEVYQTGFALQQMTYAFENWSYLQRQLQEYASRPELKVVQLRTVDEAKHVLQSKKRRIAVDLETSGFNFMEDKIGDFTFSYDGETGYHMYWDMLRNSDVLLDLVHSNMSTKDLVGSNFKFDLKFIRYNLRNDTRDWGPRHIRIDNDNVQAGHVLNEGRSNSLKAHAWMYTPYGGYDKALEDYKRTHPNLKSYLEIPDELRIPYAAKDPCIAWQVMGEMEKQFNTIVAAVDEQDFDDGSLKNREYTMYHYYKSIMMPVVNMITDVEYRGVYMNVESLEEQGEYIKGILKTLEAEIKEELEAAMMSPLPYFDLTSPTKLGKLLEEVGWPCIERNARKVYSTNDDVLKKWEYMGYSTAKKIQEYRSWAVGLSTFVGDKNEKSGWWASVRKHEDGTFRMHPNFAPMRADSGRNRCSEPNLQNIPSHGLLAKCVKKPLATPGPDYYLGAVDFDSFQLKIAAVQSKDETLYRAYSDPKGAPDIHSVTAHKIFGERLYEIQEVEFEDAKGKTHKVFGSQHITIKREGQPDESIPASEYEYKEGDVVVL